MKKPITPTVHGLLDYGFATALLTAPLIMKMGKKATRISYMLGAGTVAYSVFTDYPVAVNRSIPMRVHKKLDIANLAALVAIPILTGTVKQKKAAGLFAALLVAGISNVLFTDWDG